MPEMFDTETDLTFALLCLDPFAAADIECDYDVTLELAATTIRNHYDVDS